MTYWHLLILAVVCLILAGAVVVCSDDFDTGSDLTDLALLVAAVVLGLGSMCLGVGFVFGNLDRTACLDGGKKTGMTVEYDLLSGCYIKIDNRFIPYDRWVQVSGSNAP